MKLTKLCLFLVALLAAVCLIGCGDPGVTKTPANNNGHKIEDLDNYIDPNYDGPAVKEICYFDFESPVWSTKAFAPGVDGADYSEEKGKGKGRNGGNALYIEQKEQWGEVLIDLKNAYSKGKAYYFEAYIMDADTEQALLDTDDTASASITVWDQDIVDIAKAHNAEHYEYESSWDPSQPGPWDASPTSEYEGYEEKLLESEFIEKDEEGIIEFEPSGVTVSKTDWVKICGMVRAEDINSIVNAKAKDDLVGFQLVFFEGKYEPGQGGYKYYIDDIRILDLNPEIYAGAGVYVAKPEVEYKAEDCIINIYDDTVVYIQNDKEALYATYTLTGTLPEGIKFNTSEGYFEGELADDFVAEGEKKEFPLTVSVKSKGGEASTTLTITIINEPDSDE